MKKLLLLTFAGLLAASPAWATKRKKPEPQEANAPIQATIELPAPSEIPSEQYRLRQSDLNLTSDAVNTRMEFVFSSFFPQDLTLSSQIPASAFDGRGIPNITLALIRQLSDRPVLGGTLSMRGGLEIQSMSRTGVLGVGAIDTAISETVYWSGIQLGAEYSPITLQSRRFRPFVGLAIVPSVLISSPSVFDGGLSVFALPIEAAIGTEFVFNKLAITAAVQAKEVTLQSKNVGALAITSGLRLAL